MEKIARRSGQRPAVSGQRKDDRSTVHWWLMDTMQSALSRRIVLIIVLLMMIGLMVSNGYAETPRTHIIVMDASGSMKNQYANGLRDWLIAPLLNSGAFTPGDSVILRGFDKRGNANFLKDDPQRRYRGPFNRDSILNAVPTQTDSNGQLTAIPEALELALADIHTYNFTGDTLIWFITDNVQDVSGSGDDPIGPFYERIYNDKNFRYIYFFPIVRAGEQGALVMYLLDYNVKESSLPIPAMMDSVAKAIGHRAVLFRPIRLSALELDRSSIIFEGEDGNAQPAELEDGRIVVATSAGHSVAGRIKFKLRSKFREWKIEQAEVTNANVAIEASQTLNIAEGESLQWQLDPRTLDIGPQETSKRTYAIDLASGRALAAVAPSFLQSFFVEPEVKVTGMVRFDVVDPKLKLSFFDDAELAERIRRVKGLEQIEEFLLPRATPAAARNLTLEIPIMIKVAQPPRPIWLLILITVLMVAVIVGSVFALSAQKLYRLNGPEGERVLKLRPLSSVPLTIADEQCGELKRRFGGFVVQAFPPYVVDNGARQLKINEQSGSFIVTNSDNNRSWNFSIEAFAGESNESVGNNDMFVS